MNHNDSYESSTETDIFEEGEFIEYTEASPWQRFFNYLVDYFVMHFVIAYGTSYLLSRLVLAISPVTAYKWFDGNNIWTGFTIVIIDHLFYYTFCETLFRGHTLGKFITGTRVIREDGEEVKFKDAFLRSLSRLVPFEALSIWFGDGMWHDTWTKTKVIKTR